MDDKAFITMEARFKPLVLLILDCLGFRQKLGKNTFAMVGISYWDRIYTKSLKVSLAIVDQIAGFVTGQAYAVNQVPVIFNLGEKNLFFGYGLSDFVLAKLEILDVKNPEEITLSSLLTAA